MVKEKEAKTESQDFLMGLNFSYNYQKWTLQNALSLLAAKLSNFEFCITK